VWRVHVLRRRRYNAVNLVSHLRSQHPDECTIFSKLKVKREKERKTTIKERSKAPSSGGLHQPLFHGGSI